MKAVRVKGVFPIIQIMFRPFGKLWAHSQIEKMKPLRIVINDNGTEYDTSKTDITDSYYQQAIKLITTYYCNFIEEINSFNGYAYAECPDGKLISHQIKNIPEELIQRLMSLQ